MYGHQLISLCLRQRRKILSRFQRETFGRSSRYLAGDGQSRLLIRGSDGIGRSRSQDDGTMQLRRVADRGAVAGGVIVIIRPGDHDHGRHLHAPIVQHLMVGSPVVGIDGIVEGILRASQAIHRFQGIRTAYTRSHKRFVGRPHIVVERLCHIIQIMGITHCRAVEAIVRATLAQPQTYHIQVDTAERTV